MWRWLPLLVVTVGCGVACDSEEEPRDDFSGGFGGSGGAGGVATDGGSECFTNPQTHFEIINACTDAERIDKQPTLPLLQPDGGLPPLP